MSGPTRRMVLAGGLAWLAWPARAAEPDSAREVLTTWYRLALELIRHTPTMTPPVASRALAYLGIAAHEALVGGGHGTATLAGQLTGLAPLPRRDGGDDAVILDSALGALARTLFANTGPTGQRALGRATERLAATAAEGVDPATVDPGRRHGEALAAALLAWAATDGGAEIANLGFPETWTPGAQPGHWEPTSAVRLQQAPLLPGWGTNRPFALPAADAIPMPGPTPYDETPGSRFHAEAMEVRDVSQALTEEQGHIARFWSDDAMLTWTPPGHWTAILLQVADQQALPTDRLAEGLARIGVAMADAFIACWHMKYAYDTVRPITYIRRVIDPGWTPLLLTPPFPEYPSGHSVQSAAAAAVLTDLFGDLPFSDESPTPDGVPPRSFASFTVAADESAISRLYGGIHFRPAIEHGQDLGRATAATAIALRTR